MEKFEYYKKRKQKRENLKKDLPIDKQLEASLGKNKWEFKNPLYSIRNSEDPSDKYFIEKLRQNDKEDLLDDSLDILQEAKEKEEKNMMINLKGEMLIK